MIINRNYKDRLFRMIFHDKESLLELYNAINGTFYEDEDELEITTIQDAIYMSFKNDVSFLVRAMLNLYEHQSTMNPNMTIRGFFYLADLYRKYIEANDLNLYSSKSLKLPIPVYVVFYNGLMTEPDRTELYLSDCFEKVTGVEPCLECKAIILNINLGHNRVLMERCRKLSDYASLVYQVRRFGASGMEPDAAVDAAVTYCINNGIMEEWLSQHRAEVKDVLLTEYDEEKHIRMERAESRAEGVEEGITTGRAYGKSEIILEFLRELGEIPAELHSAILSQQNLDVLNNWAKVAAKVGTVEEFWKTIQLEK